MLASGAAIMVAAQAVAALPLADFSNVAVTPGRWSYTAMPGGSDASFRDTAGAVRLVIRCNGPLRRVSISRIGAVPAASLGLWTSSAVRTLAARFDLTTQRITTDLTAYDPLLDGIAFSRGRIAVSMPGFAPLVVPAWSEPARAVEDCRI